MTYNNKEMSIIKLTGEGSNIYEHCLWSVRDLSTGNWIKADYPSGKFYKICRIWEIKGNPNGTKIVLFAINKQNGEHRKLFLPNRHTRVNCIIAKDDLKKKFYIDVSNNDV